MTFPRALLASLLVFLAPASFAIEFNNVVSLGDSLLDDPLQTRSPLVSEQIATRLGAPLTQLAIAGSRSATLLERGQHTEAAANFGEGDLALVWIGGNDFRDAALAVTTTGDISFLNTLEANVDEILTTLRGAGMEVVLFNLPDFSLVPGIMILLPTVDNLRETSIEWATRLDALAEQHGAHVVDIFTAFDQLTNSPELFAVDGNMLVSTPTVGNVMECPFCVWFDEIHPSSLGQGIISNAAITLLNSVYDVAGVAPLSRVSATEFASLASVNTFASIAGLWFDADFAGEGYDVVQTASGTTIFYYGYDADGNRLWLISNTVSERFALGEPTTFQMRVGDEGGSFEQPIAPSELTDWGTLVVTLNDCGTGLFDLQGRDGNKQHNAQLLAGVAGTSCTTP